jgi:glycosyltransferase involved in cell wall biosynthesis
MRVLWLSHSGNIAGAELCLAEGVDALSARGHEVHVVLPAEGSLRSRLTAAAEVHVCGYNRFATTTPPPLRNRVRWLAYDAQRASRDIAGIANVTGADVIVTNTLSIAAGALAARRATLPHIWFLHEFGLEDHGLQFNFGRTASLGLMKRHTDVFLVNSDALRHHFARWLPDRMLRRVHYAVDMPADIPSDDCMSTSAIRLVLVGERKTSKGQHDAVAAVGLLARAGIELELELIGRGEPRFDSELREHADRAGIASRVRMMDFSADHLRRVAAADVVLMCSRSEALGRVTIEAMKLAKPVIGAAAGATVELIRHEWNGLLYQPGDAPALAGAIDRLRCYPDTAHELGRRGQQWAQSAFNREVYGAELEAAFVADR